jgi:DNA-binding response OmpR family regulator
MPERQHILIVDDDPRIREIVGSAIGTMGYRCSEAGSGEEALRVIGKENVDLVILDLSMPGMDGLTVLQGMRQQARFPIIILSGHEDRDHKIETFVAGADDYVTKPFDPAELAARVFAVLRRSTATHKPQHDEDFYFDRARAQIWHMNKPLRLSAMEFRLLGMLLDHGGQTLPFETIVTELWGRDSAQARAALRVLVWRLRKKIEAQPDDPSRLLTEETGYRMRLEGTQTPTEEAAS